MTIPQKGQISVILHANTCGWISDNNSQRFWKFTTEYNYILIKQKRDPLLVYSYTLALNHLLSCLKSMRTSERYF